MSGMVLKDVSKSFDGKPVLKNISLELEAGELLVLLGPSGCGKSTLLRIIAGLEEVDSGEVYIDSKRVDHMRPRDRNVALVFQNYSLYPHMTIEKNLAFPLKVAGVPKREISHRVREVAELLGLADRLGDRPGQLSGGQRQRVALGRAIIREPSIFLLDEPLSNLDAGLRVRMRQEIVRLQKDLGRTMIHVTHDQAEALTMGDRIALINEGRIEQIDVPDRLYNRPASRFVASFVGHPQINLIKGKVVDGQLVPFGLRIPPGLSEHKNDDLMIGLRPEAIKLSGNAPFLAEVVSCEYVGDSYIAELSFQSAPLTASNVEHSLETGQSVRFSIDEDKLILFDKDSGRNLAAG
jgi:multiple sugar transport system ATP-binding protein